MNVHQLLMENDFEKIWSKSKRPSEQKHFFESIYLALLSKVPKPNIEKMKVIMKLVKENDESYYDVTGMQEEDEQGYDISMTNWDEIAGYDVELSDNSIATFIIELLYEITFYGMEEDMVKERNEMNVWAESIENGTIKTYSIDDLFEDLDDEEL